MNSAIFVGRLGKDCEVKTFDGGKSVINFSVAIDVGFGDKKETLWIDCAKWGEKTGVATYLKKGQQVAVIGEIGLRKWEGGAAVTLRVANIELVGANKQDGSSPGTKEAEGEEPIGDLPF